MSFSDNLQVLRKRNNLTQEQLAEQLEVSRQAVSKWESGQSYPEMEKLLIICDMFHCDMDSLVKGDMTLEDQADAAGYDRFMNSFSHRITGCVTLILAAVTLMAFLDGIVHEDILAIFLIAVVGVSVAVMIVTGINMEAFEKKYPHIQDFYSEEERSVFTRRFGIAIAFAVCLILFGICVNIALDSINIPLKEQFSGGFSCSVSPLQLVCLCTLEFRRKSTRSRNTISATMGAERKGRRSWERRAASSCFWLRLSSSIWGWHGICFGLPGSFTPSAEFSVPL